MIKEAEYAIEVEKLTKRYGDLPAVNDISFNVRKGEVFALLGPNGAGKTTTVEIIDTIRTPTSGKVRLLGMDVTKKKHDIVPRIGVLPQGFSSFDRITVRETMQYYSRLFRCINADIDGLIALVNLTDKAEEQYMNLSGGLKQRLGIAIALVNDPEVVFLDEPTTGLDPRARREVWEVLLGLKKEGKTVFLTTHYMEEAELLADTVAIISKGKIIAMDSPVELIESNSNYLVLTLQPVDEKAFEIVRKMGFAPVHDNHKNIKVKVAGTDDVRKILNAIEGRRGVVASAWTFESPTSKRSSLSSPARRFTKARPGERGRNESARHRRKSRREHQELLPREDRNVLHVCVPDTPDTRVRHYFQGPGELKLQPLRAGPRPDRNLGGDRQDPRSYREVQDHPGQPRHRRHAVRQEQQAEPCAHYSPRL